MLGNTYTNCRVSNIEVFEMEVCCRMWCKQWSRYSDNEIRFRWRFVSIVLWEKVRRMGYMMLEWIWVMDVGNIKRDDVDILTYWNVDDTGNMICQLETYTFALHSRTPSNSDIIHQCFLSMWLMRSHSKYWFWWELDSNIVLIYQLASADWDLHQV